ncbi:MAG: DUF1517 domain-containing protein [Pseudanabaenaceae cyanobacterium SKYGB_i_bin29]|nr:DUF1517 domain-containing protein [Pseudanabaenaceae cyanobacterium SKYG29]MDW8421571.1 DUF1517 domain-containing protein [Pseudanabaenaceae cyanobacterium SKYGB_i_bin29]
MARLRSVIRRLAGIFSLCLLVMVIIFGAGQPAWAKRASGRVGGSTFRAQPRRQTNNFSSRSHPSYNYYYSSPFPSSWFWFPFLLGGGGGSLLSLLVLVAIGGILVQGFRNSGIFNSQSKVTVAKVQVGLLASARGLQADLNRLALESDTNSPSGLGQLLQETTLALLRHPEYWVYGSVKQETVALDRAEQTFNALAIGERSKQAVEVLSNVHNRRQEQQALTGTGDPSEYIVVTIMVAATGLPQLPTIRSAQDLRQAITTVGSVGADNLLAVEVIWEPQSPAYTLTADDMIAVYPELVRI